MFYPDSRIQYCLDFEIRDLTILSLFLPSNLGIHDHSKEKLSDKTAPQSYSARCVASHVREDEQNAKYHR